MRRFIRGLFALMSFAAVPAMAQTTVTFSATGAEQTFVVPVGVTEIQIDAWGAQGGANWVNNVNFGGYATGRLQVTPGSTLYIYVGTQGLSVPSASLDGGFNGGGAGDNGGAGGGGASDVRVGGNGLANRVIVAGGGGGAGFWSNLHVRGGVGGGNQGGDGDRNGTDAGGKGGTQTAGGADGTCVSFNVVLLAGTLGQGGTPAGQSCGCEGYGGGGGLYGGAGSGNCRGGGGGSGYIGGVTNGTNTAGVRQGNGEVRITWTLQQQTLTFPAQTVGTRPFAANATFPIDPVATSASPNSGNPITYSSTTPSVCSVAGTTVTILAVGTCTIAADQADGAGYAAAARVTRDVTVTPAAQSLSFPAQTVSTRPFAANATFPIDPVATSATPNSGNPITYSSTTPSVCSVAGTTVTILAVGTCTIAADQADGAGYAAAARVTRDVTIAPASQSLSFPAQTTSSRTFAANATFAIDPLATSATPNSGNPITYSSTTLTICSVTGTTVTMLAVGTCTIAADQAGSANFAAATRATQSVNIGLAPQALVFPTQSIASRAFIAGGSFPLEPLASTTGPSSGNPIMYSSLTPSVCTISGTTVTMLSAGVCQIAANQAGDANFAAAPTAISSILLASAQPVEVPLGGKTYLLMLLTLLGLAIRSLRTSRTTRNA